VKTRPRIDSLTISCIRSRYPNQNSDRFPNNFVLGLGIRDDENQASDRSPNNFVLGLGIRDGENQASDRSPNNFVLGLGIRDGENQASDRFPNDFVLGLGIRDGENQASDRFPNDFVLGLEQIEISILPKSYYLFRLVSKAHENNSEEFFIELIHAEIKQSKCKNS
jgi:hypothetical protein